MATVTKSRRSALTVRTEQTARTDQTEVTESMARTASPLNSRLRTACGTCPIMKVKLGNLPVRLPEIREDQVRQETLCLLLWIVQIQIISSSLSQMDAL